MLKRNRTLSWTLASIAACGVPGLAAYLYVKSQAGVVASYSITPVTRGTITQSIGTIGQLAPSVSVEISSQISGLVTEVSVDFNSKVTKGQTLAKIDPSSYEQRLRQAAADLAAAQSAHELARVHSKRLQDLLNRDLIARQDYDESAALLEQSSANLLTKRASVVNARLDLARCTLRSPIDGVVIYRQIEVGKTVVSSMSAPILFTIAQDLSKMRIVAPVNEIDVGMIHPGLPASFTIEALGEKEFHGRLLQVRNPYVPSDKQAAQEIAHNAIATFDAVIEVDNSALLLRPSMTASIAIIYGRREHVLRIPNSALRVPQTRASFQTIAERATVYRVHDLSKTAQPDPVVVKVGISDDFNTEILDGLREGDHVVTDVAARSERPRASTP